MAGAGAAAATAAAVREVVDTTGALLRVHEVATAPIDGQKPGTSGLRKKTRVFMEGHYLHNFVQSVFDALPAEEVRGSTLVVGGDGRYWSGDAIQIIAKIAVANGVRRLWIGHNGLLSTPAVSAVVRQREGGVAYGAIILTASHNPGGLDEDFGIKYNVKNGGPAPESVTDAIYACTKRVTKLRMCVDLPAIDLATIGTTIIKHGGGASAGAGAGTAPAAGDVIVQVIDSVEDYAALLSRVFDFPALRTFLARPNFRMAYDGLSGVAGAYATRILGDILGVPAASLHNCVPLPDFGGHHPDPNLTYASELVATMGLKADGTADASKAADTVPDFGAAQDGDADRNMVLGRRFAVTPSDSVAIIAAHAEAIPFFRGGLKGVARSMPTSAALDAVAARPGLKLFEVPTGWKFFGNLMDSALLGKGDYNPFLCGEESFGTGSNHVREKDGLWAVLAWLSILEKANREVAVGAPLVSVEAIVRAHWAEYGRNYYCRYDYEGVESAAADAVIARLRAHIAAFNAAKATTAAHTDEFRYVDPVDGSVSDKQGLRFIMSDGSRVVYRLSGTGSVGATIRVYIEKYERDAARLGLATSAALHDLVGIALSLSDIAGLTGRAAPTVIT